jgi:hypothetical protein
MTAILFASMIHYFHLAAPISVILDHRESYVWPIAAALGVRWLVIQENC